MNNNDIQWTAEEKWINRKVKTLMENERNGETDKIRVEPSKIAKTTWQYCRPLYEDSWVVFNSYNEVYEFSFTCG